MNFFFPFILLFSLQCRCEGYRSAQRSPGDVGDKDLSSGQGSRTDHEKPLGSSDEGSSDEGSSDEGSSGEGSRGEGSRSSPDVIGDEESGSGENVSIWHARVVESQRTFHEQVAALASQLTILRSMSPETLSSHVVLSDFLRLDRTSSVGNILKKCEVERFDRSELQFPVDALCSSCMRALCLGEEVFLPPILTRNSRPRSVFENELGVVADQQRWERLFRHDKTLQSVMQTHGQTNAVGMAKVGFEGLVNMLVAGRQLVSFAGALSTLDAAAKQFASGPHGPFYVLLQDYTKNTEGKKAPLTPDRTIVYTPSDWFGILMPDDFVLPLVDVLMLASKPGPYNLMGKGTHVRRDEINGIEAFILRYSLPDDQHADVLLLSYSQMAQMQPAPEPSSP
eukprot:TRINITY_DN6728_c0_g1_i1.p1 TRINITY_DN6728_c0_g1~~TRINITY_DN6728_c0_g1_i1.p1  ORF type:complete len:395 (-),score=60.39 TRINITY_DN6728_c0_g1_i1:110-1294(-)